MNYLSTPDANELYKALMSLESSEECKKFLRDLLTESEIKEIINRWKVVRMLNKKVPYEQIVDKTGMSTTTIARISKWLHNGTGGYRLLLKRLELEENED